MSDAPDYFIFQADVYCRACTRDIKRRLKREGARPADPSDETSYDSDEWPKGPFSGEEADTPQHCGSGEHCLDPTELPDGSKVGQFFENPLTKAGVQYVIEQASPPITLVEELWLAFYDDYPEIGAFNAARAALPDALPTEPSEGDYVTQDYINWREYGGSGKPILILRGDPHQKLKNERPAWLAAVSAIMNKEKFWPNAWFQGERGDWNLLDLGNGGYLVEKK